jgi:CheY-like chemotaxis protein
MYKVLLVDDEQSVLDSIGDVLSENGYEVLKTSNGTQALELLSKTEVDLILLDIIMPGLNGREVMQRIKQDPMMSMTPVIFLTNVDPSSNDRLMEEIMAEPPMFYLVKGNCSTEDVLNKVKQVLGTEEPEMVASAEAVK